MAACFCQIRLSMRSGAVHKYIWLPQVEFLRELKKQKRTGSIEAIDVSITGVSINEVCSTGGPGVV